MQIMTIKDWPVATSITNAKTIEKYEHISIYRT